MIADQLLLTNVPQTFNVTLRLGPNVVTATALNVGEDPFYTVQISVPTDELVYGQASQQAGLAAGGATAFILGLPLIITDGSRYPEPAQHIIDALGTPKIYTIDRPGTKRRRDQNTARYDSLVQQGLAPAVLPGQERDEAPLAVFLESDNASVRPIDAKQNSGAGGNLGQQLSRYDPANKKLPDGSNVEFFATPPTVTP